MTQHLERAKEEERRAIAQEIHDDIGGALTALKFELVRLARGSAAIELRGPSSMRCRNLLESAVVASHRIQHALRPAVLDAGLVAALEWLARGFAERSGIKIDFQANREDFEIAPDRAAALYRVAQEALTNIRKHASAKRVHMQLFALGDEITLEVARRRPGIRYEQPASHAGFRRPWNDRACTRAWVDGPKCRRRRAGGTTVMFSIPPLADRSAHPEVADGGAMTIRLFVVDDHAIVRRGIVQVLCEHPEVQIIAEASDYAGLRTRAEEAR